jgi:hypothetical protein
LIPNRSFWRTTRGVITLVAIVIVLLGGGIGAYLLTANNPTTQSAAPQTSSSPSTDPSLGVKPYGADAPTDYQKQDAIAALHAYPEYYQCRTYPSDAALTQADLVPTDNVVATITYDPHKKKYVVQGDPRITHTEHDSIQPISSDFTEPTPEQDFTFGFAPGVHYFNSYSTPANNPQSWGGSYTLYGSRVVDGKVVQNFSLTLYTGKQKDWPQYVIIATDTSSCAAGSTPLPAGFNWNKLAQSGLLVPEFYNDGSVHPQG